MCPMSARAIGASVFLAIVRPTLHPTARKPIGYSLAFLAAQRFGVMRIAAEPKSVDWAACIDAFANAGR